MADEPLVFGGACLHEVSLSPDETSSDEAPAAICTAPAAASCGHAAPAASASTSSCTAPAASQRQPRKLERVHRQQRTSKTDARQRRSGSTTRKPPKKRKRTKNIKAKDEKDCTAPAAGAHVKDEKDCTAPAVGAHGAWFSVGTTQTLSQSESYWSDPLDRGRVNFGDIQFSPWSHVEDTVFFMTDQCRNDVCFIQAPAETFVQLVFDMAAKRWPGGNVCTAPVALPSVEERAVLQGLAKDLMKVRDFWFLFSDEVSMCWYLATYREKVSGFDVRTLASPGVPRGNNIAEVLVHYYQAKVQLHDMRFLFFAAAHGGTAPADGSWHHRDQPADGSLHPKTCTAPAACKDDTLARFLARHIQEANINVCCGWLADQYDLLKNVQAERKVPHDWPICQKFRLPGDNGAVASRTQWLIWADARTKFSTQPSHLFRELPTETDLWEWKCNERRQFGTWAEEQFMPMALLPRFTNRDGSSLYRTCGGGMALRSVNIPDTPWSNFAICRRGHCLSRRDKLTPYPDKAIAHLMFVGGGNPSRKSRAVQRAQGRHGGYGWRGARRKEGLEFDWWSTRRGNLAHWQAPEYYATPAAA